MSVPHQVPAPHRGEVVRQIGHALREKKTLLGKLVSNNGEISDELSSTMTLLCVLLCVLGV